MNKLIAVLLVVGVVFLVACDYQAPPGGPDSYCWRIVQERTKVPKELVFYTNKAPRHNGDSVTIRDAWFAVQNTWPVSDRYDRYVEKVVLNEVLGGITIEQRCEPSKSKG